MNYYLLIPAIIVLIMFLPIQFEVRASLNFHNLSGAVGAFVFKRKIIHSLIWIKGKKIVTRSEGKTDTQEIEFNGKEIIFLEMFSSQIKKKTRLKKLAIYYNIGLKDAFLTCYLCGIINFIISILFARIKSERPTATLENNDTVSYNLSIMQASVVLKFSISLFDVVYSLLCSVILTRKKQKAIAKEKACSENKNLVGRKAKSA